MIPQLTTDKRCLCAVSPGTTEIDGVRLLASDPTMREYKTEFLSCGSAGGGDICFLLADSGDGMDLTVIEECSIRSEDIVHIAADITILEIIPIELMHDRHFRSLKEVRQHQFLHITSHRVSIEDCILPPCETTVVTAQPVGCCIDCQRLPSEISGTGGALDRQIPQRDIFSGDKNYRRIKRPILSGTIRTGLLCTVAVTEDGHQGIISHNLNIFFADK